MRKTLSVLGLLVFLASCMKGQSVDLIVRNARIHSMDDKNTIYQAMAIRDGKIVELGPERQILNKYSSDEEIDAEGKDVFPGFSDAHGHMMGYARQLLSADLVGSNSMEDLLVRVEKYDQKENRKFVVGRGWDQSLWGKDEFPTNAELNKLFPDKPVMLHRIDGHAVLVNQALLDAAKINESTKIDGGEIVLKDGKCTGVLIDNAINLVAPYISDFSNTDLSKALQEVQQELFQYGITSVHEAGVSQKEYQLIKQLVDEDKLNLDLYVMLMASEENFDFAKKYGKIEHKNMIVRSFKVMGDGALGSHGALLKKPYSDDPKTIGLLTSSPDFLKRVSSVAELTGYQVNIHAIGDSTNRLALQMMLDIYAKNKDHRWRLEHAQVIDLADFGLVGKSGCFPSVQPTHATSDQRWAETRVGADRLKGAYAYKTLLNQAGMLALGTDFPVELTNPYLTMYAAVKRKNADGDPLGGFLPDEALTEEECLRGMTIWPAFASFQEDRIGTLEVGKEATFVILSLPFEIKDQFESNYAHLLYIKGVRRFSAEDL